MAFPTPATKNNCDASTDDPKQALLVDLATLIDKFNELLAAAAAAGPIESSGITGAAALAGATFTGALNEKGFTVAAHATTCDIWAGGNYGTLTGTAVTFTDVADAPVADAWRLIRSNAAHVLTNNANIAVQGGANLTLADGDLMLWHAITTTTFEVYVLKKSGLATVAPAATVLRSYLAGLSMSTAGSSATMSIAVGQAADSTNAVTMALAAAISKTTSAWAVGTGNGGLDTGSIANSAWYYFYLIRRPDTGVVDVVFSTSYASPTLPTNYTQYRYIGAGLTNGSGQWTAFTQQGREFYWKTPVLDFGAAGSTTAALLTCSLPRGRKMKGFFNLYNLGGGFYISDPDNTDMAPNTAASPLYSQGGTTGNLGNQADCWTDTSARIRHREPNANAVYIATLGWLDLADTNI